MTDTYIVHGAVRSSAAYRVRIVMKLKGLAYREIFLDLAGGDQNKDDYRAVNPQGLVPALVCPDGAVINQSMAIIEYLDDMHPEQPVMPRDARSRARVRALSQMIACDIHPINNMRVRNHIRDLFPDDPNAVTTWMERWSKAGFDALEARLASDKETGRFCHGDTPTMADACLVPQVANARLSSRDLSPYPTVVRIAEACEALPAFVAARPDKQS
ncbi:MULTISPECIES: maleylacetoacetate isomerase [unclassified Beijerinckia]|uniref:maleylacetoacetate isomerase n=1 Tax=unclassified Beijerinckia TaxID=2638183 RepID=UPI00089426F6|nr:MULTISPECIES: maleylacetoacetate isomerase [unclassified Beijerinckia]MDH7798200.1 maleylacetoacetate isomerase [Beijerinckia sp. GAS462]SED12616.1 maleylacetoacetate isomerase/maleylpyruvate isomerase [Beijerinckia sp. 28-YEA-48]